MTSPTAPSTPAPTAASSQTPAPAPQGGQETAPAQPPATPPSPQGDPKALAAAVKRTVALKQKEAAIHKRAEALKPLEDLQKLVETNPAAAFRKLAGDARLLDVYKAVTEDVVGLQSEEKALEALPKSVREKLARLEELEKKAPLVDELQGRLAALEKSREEAQQAFTARQRTDMAERVYSAGYEAVTGAAAELPLVLKNPRGGELVQEAWTALLGEKKAELAKLDGVERQQFAAGLVLEAAKRVQERLTDELAWLLPSSGNGVKVDPTRAAASGAAKSTQQPPAPSTPGQQRLPRTGTPGSLGEPTGKDPRKLTPQQRLNQLRDEERAGRLYPR